MLGEKGMATSASGSEESCQETALISIKTWRTGGKWSGSKARAPATVVTKASDPPVPSKSLKFVHLPGITPIHPYQGKHRILERSDKQILPKLPLLILCSPSPLILSSNNSQCGLDLQAVAAPGNLEMQIPRLHSRFTDICFKWMLWVILPQLEFESWAVPSSLCLEQPSQFPQWAPECGTSISCTLVLSASNPEFDTLWALKTHL